LHRHVITGKWHHLGTKINMSLGKGCIFHAQNFIWPKGNKNACGIALWVSIFSRAAINSG